MNGSSILSDMLVKIATMFKFQNIFHDVLIGASIWILCIKQGLLNSHGPVSCL